MSEKKSKEDRKLKIMTEEAGLDETARQMAKSIAKMYEDRDKKVLNARNHLVSQLKVTSDKYRTANGVMSALDTVRLVFGNNEPSLAGEVSIAKMTASEIAVITVEMADKARELDPENMDELCDGFYDKEFSEGEGSVIDMVRQLMILQLCQNVGPSAEDIMEFCRTADEEIDKAREDLKKFCKDNDLDYLEVCGEKSE